ncbi:hypothetical protein KVR01_000897 [Diaporthe batatas]|uniref:uncharacterized protein n=1 Tax=Diaporthe batatas TaxID=748121 RepID=UPI001D0364B8|nr:uncharacterized protein KVR01_000897 [Diaporthe batatas]KAG8170152.1 hypothetical protein KVR01_000897 [Diaporthe batatas]
MTTKQTILITGCSDHSLGSALALAFHKAGWRVFASARNLSKLKLAEEAGIETLKLDITSEESIAACVAAVQELTGGPLDALLNNAGAAYSLPLLDIDIDKAKGLFDLNVWSMLRVTRAFVPLLMQSRAGGRVINNTSGASTVAGSMPWQGAYNASKAAATSVTETLRLELSPFGIRVINIITGSVKSTFFDNAPPARLPPTSIYAPAKDIIEQKMAGAVMDENGADQNVWAAQVVRDLNKNRPTYWVWRGSHTTILRIANLLPVGFMDSIMRKMTGLDLVEQRIKEQGDAGKVKSS